MAALDVLSESKKVSQRRVSCDTLCSSNSSCVLLKKKPIHPLAVIHKKTNNTITQRVLSAKVLRFKTLQNQLNDANIHVSQLITENRMLKSLQKRQDNALQKYEGVQADLPQVLESHHEEIRVLQTKNKNLRKNMRELMTQIKTKDEELYQIRDQNKHLMELCKNKNLDEKEKLVKKVQDMEERLRQSDSTISTLNRKILLENKNNKYKLNGEIAKHKQTQKELHRALSQIEALHAQPELKGKFNIRRPFICDRKCPTTPSESQTSTSKRLSAGTKTTKTCTSSSSNLSEETDSIYPNRVQIAPKKKMLKEIDTSAEAQLKEIVSNWHKKNEKSDKNTNGECCNAFNAQDYDEILEKNKMEFKQSMRETETILEALNESDNLSAKLNQLKISDVYTDDTESEMKLPKVERKFYSFEEEELLLDKEKWVNNVPEVDNEDKQKLLATLRAIDNGDKIEITPIKKSKDVLMRELFG